MKKSVITIMLIGVPQVLLIVFTCITALLTPAFYKLESGNWQVQSLGQDIIDCFLVTPVLVIAVFLIVKGNTKAYDIWGGVNLYLTYTYLIYCFAVHFNSFFLIYCIILGLSFYSSVLFFYRLVQEKKEPPVNGRSFYKTTAIYFIAIAVVFSLLWLKDIIPAVLHNQTPAILNETELLTSPVHVIDLSIFLPALFVTGFLMLKKKEIALKLAPALLVFMILMNLTIGFLTIFMKQKGIESDLAVPAFMILLAVFSFILLKRLRSSSDKPGLEKV
jgi:hypothetical protein